MSTTTGQDGRLEADRLATLVALQRQLDHFESDPLPLLRTIANQTCALTGAAGSALGRLDAGEIRWTVGAGTLTRLTGDREKDDIVGAKGSARSVPEATDSLLVPIYGEDGIAGYLRLESGEDYPWSAADRQTAQLLAAFAGAVYARVAVAEPPPNEAQEPVGPVPFHALLDRVTGLPNRTLLFDRLAQAIQIARREDELLAVLVADLADLETSAGDSGRNEVDAIAVEVASRLRDTLRASDTVARTSPDGFTIVLPGANAIGALGTAKKLVRSVTAPFQFEEREVSLRIRIGIAVYPDHGDEVAVLLAHAEQGLTNIEDAQEYASVQLFEDE